MVVVSLRNACCPTCGRVLYGEGAPEHVVTSGHSKMGLLNPLYSACAEHFKRSETACVGEWQDQYGLVAKVDYYNVFDKIERTEYKRIV